MMGCLVIAAGLWSRLHRTYTKRGSGLHDGYPMARNRPANTLVSFMKLRTKLEDGSCPSGVSPGAADSTPSAREEAVRRMLEFGEKHRLSLGEPITRKLLDEGHRY